MKTTIKQFGLMAAVLAMSLVATQAQILFTDNFTRSNTASPNGGLGTDWTIAGNMFLNTNHAQTQTAAESFALYNGASLSQSFSMSVDIYSQSTGRYGGLLFNYVDSSNYYELRANFNSTSTVWQFIKVIGGTSTTVSQSTIAAGNMPVDTWRTLTLNSSATTGQYTFALTNVGGATTYASGTLTDTNLSLGGSAGFYFSGSNAWADNFSLQTVPEPMVSGMLGMSVLLAFLRRRRLSDRLS
ncbi:MAG: hypothetical protein B9S32_09965 [Verrucomicrobia bacterium Tous-C9LFEB]|nr:MAG: hypothetical protein B9S32_09965 [Verrucomicrobia bacterium Tous-C9LFEB]